MTISEALEYMQNDIRYYEPTCEADQKKKERVDNLMELAISDLLECKKFIEELEEICKKSYLIYGWIPKDKILYSLAKFKKNVERRKERCSQ